MTKFEYYIKKIAIVAVVMFIVFIVNILVTTGFFRTIHNQFEGKILQKIDLPGAEDITLSLVDSFAVISSTNRAIFPPTNQEKGGLYLLNLKNNSFTLKHLTPDFNGPFAPHGISMIKNDSTYKVMAINHTINGHCIEVFHLKGDKLTHEKTLKHDSMISPNDLVMLDNNRFYFTNDHKYTSGIRRLLEDYVGLSLSNVVYFDGENYREVANRIAYANGINYDSDRNLLYVASPRKFLIKVYTRNENGTLNFIENIKCGTGVDNIELDSKGNLWIGAHPNLLKFTAYAKGKQTSSPSEIIKVNYQFKNDYSVKKIFVDDGTTMSSSSVAAPFRDLIITGNVKDDHFLVLKKGN